MTNNFVFTQEAHISFFWSFVALGVAVALAVLIVTRSTSTTDFKRDLPYTLAHFTPHFLVAFIVAFSFPALWSFYAGNVEVRVDRREAFVAWVDENYDATITPQDSTRIFLGETVRIESPGGDFKAMLVRSSGEGIDTKKASGEWRFVHPDGKPVERPE